MNVNNTGIRDSGLRTIAASCSKLRSIDLRGCSWDGNHSERIGGILVDHSEDIISDVGITALATHCRYLTCKPPPSAST